MKLAPGQLRLKKEPSVLVLVEPSALSQPRATYNGDPTIEAPGAAAEHGLRASCRFGRLPEPKLLLRVTVTGLAGET